MLAWLASCLLRLNCMKIAGDVDGLQDSDWGKVEARKKLSTRSSKHGSEPAAWTLPGSAVDLLNLNLHCINNKTPE